MELSGPGGFADRPSSAPAVCGQEEQDGLAKDVDADPAEDVQAEPEAPAESGRLIDWTMASDD